MLTLFPIKRLCFRRKVVERSYLVEQRVNDRTENHKHAQNLIDHRLIS